MKFEAIELFKQFSDNTRLRSLMLMQAGNELCVCELIHAIGESQPKISRHLAQLRKSALVVDRKQGQWVYYRLNPELPGWIKEVLTRTFSEVSTQQPYVSDIKKLSEMPNRPGGLCCN